MVLFNRDRNNSPSTQARHRRSEAFQPLRCQGATELQFRTRPIRDTCNLKTRRCRERSLSTHSKPHLAQARRLLLRNRGESDSRDTRACLPAIQFRRRAQGVFRSRTAANRRTDLPRTNRRTQAVNNPTGPSRRTKRKTWAASRSMDQLRAGTHPGTMQALLGPMSVSRRIKSLRTVLAKWDGRMLLR